jgi:predicted phage terminase large subunit-like protein
MGNDFFALHQQTPKAASGDMFDRADFEIIPALPKGKVIGVVRYWDKAGTKDAGAYTAGARMWEIKPEGQESVFIIDDMIMGQWASGEREKVITGTAASDGRAVHVVVEQEPGSGGKESAENTIKSLAGYVVSADRPSGDKTLRAEPLSSQASIGNVKLVAGPWVNRFLQIVTAFPSGAIKDPVDACSGAFAYLNRHTEPASETVEVDKEIYKSQRRDSERRRRSRWQR